MLANIVGKGVIGGKIVYFGVSMQTNWTSTAGKTPMSMSSNLNVALNSNGTTFMPTITYSTRGSMPGQVANPANQMNGSGLQNIQGVTQAIQIGGNDNYIQNGMSLNVIKGAPAISNLPTGETTMAQYGTTHTSNVTMTVAPGQLSMLINNGANTIQQGIGSNGVFQMVQVQSNLNAIQNTMKLTLGVDPIKSQGLDLAQLNPALMPAMPQP
ncbi:MAG: hypothetical protein JJ714_08635 [Acidithiobacillus sp.]|nr:hypothetical protein [Acidithiobacillus sp.]